MLTQGEMSKVKVFGTDEQVKEEITTSAVPVIVDFYANWCGPCKILGPVLDSVSEKFCDDISIVKVDVDKHGELAAENDVQSVPTLIFYAGGKEVKRTTGFMPEEKLTKVIEETLGVKV